MKPPIKSWFRGAVAGGWLFSLVAVAFAQPPAAGAQEPKRPAQGAADAKQPVILLTGFEPFGRGKPPNSSWEGIKQLDGREWKGYRLVCKQVPVVWGAPLEHLPGWISQHQPVAIFSFGQGDVVSFAIESYASNRRAKAKDNLGELPPVRQIVADGPREFQATSDCARLARLLVDKKHDIRVSTSAGRYLCEEALYSLEYLKSTKQLKATVLFCHVPPLGEQVRLRHVLRLLAVQEGPGLASLPIHIPFKQVSAADVQRFVEDLLETWHAVHKDRVPAERAPPGSEETSELLPVATKAQAKEARDTDVKEVKEFIQRYFRTWSEQDMKGYDACFLPSAVIQHIDDAGRLTSQPRSEFVAGQKEYHRTATHRAVEVPVTIDTRFEEKLARVVVYWKLTAGPRTETGYDHFTLMRHDGNWRIVNLVFYATKS